MNNSHNQTLASYLPNRRCFFHSRVHGNIVMKYNFDAISGMGHLHFSPGSTMGSCLWKEPTAIPSAEQTWKNNETRRERVRKCTQYVLCNGHIGNALGRNPSGKLGATRGMHSETHGTRVCIKNSSENTQVAHPGMNGVTVEQIEPCTHSECTGNYGGNPLGIDGGTQEAAHKRTNGNKWLERRGTQGKWHENTPKWRQTKPMKFQAPQIEIASLTCTF